MHGADGQMAADEADEQTDGQGGKAVDGRANGGGKGADS